jgi:hypothetical protein
MVKMTLEELRFVPGDYLLVAVMLQLSERTGELGQEEVGHSKHSRPHMRFKS